ncbi:BON domain-containing protein [Rhizobium lemnae]|jgi:osmotically-inducible protein OsmY|uniref:BON domain-containing protein n=1 Tax=Rhizobium lemnae TaxID=1214924 RepID=A0ABV8E570_9HYPH|nr:BON domain-containing protein [Rhizobium lemnae]MCJ8507301.1 BON domain-containing protein [Rhizobium lemnae]
MVFKPQTFHEKAPTVVTEFPTEAALEAQVAAALAEAGGLDAADISVTTKAGTVTLIGRVLLDSQIERAEEVARSVPNVTDVVNKLVSEQTH